MRSVALTVARAVGVAMAGSDVEGIDALDERSGDGRAANKVGAGRKRHLNQGSVISRRSSARRAGSGSQAGSTPTPVKCRQAETPSRCSTPAPKEVAAGGDVGAVGASKNAARLVLKDCKFLCGSASSVHDPVALALAPEGVDVSTLPRIRWGKDGCNTDRFDEGVPAGDVASCWYCERTYQNQAHKHNGRKACQKAIGEDLTKREEFHSVRKSLIERRVLGHSADRRKGQGVRKKTLKQKQARQSRLLPPKSKFWPMDQYEAMFGNPKSTDNVRRGHKKTTIGKFKGVIVPGDDSFDKPWDLEVGYLDELALEEDLHVLGSQDDEDLPEELENKFNDMADAEDKDLAAACTGQSYESMMKELLAASDADGGDEEDVEPDDAGRAAAEARRTQKHKHNTININV